MRRVSLVTLYGPKPRELAGLIRRCQAMVAGVPGVRFARYDLGQVHATLVGLQQAPGSPMHNRNLARYRGRSARMDVRGFIEFIRTSGHVPFQVQVGGFQDGDHPFTSQGQRPQERAFSIQGRKVVMLGWPIRCQPRRVAAPTTRDRPQDARRYPNTLDDIRRAAQAFNILHAYHRAPGDVDNDFYFRIGLIKPESLDERAKRELEGRVKEFLSGLEPVVLTISLADIYLVWYQDARLPRGSTWAWSLQDGRLSRGLIERLYGGPPRAEG